MENEWSAFACAAVLTGMSIITVIIVGVVTGRSYLHLAAAVGITIGIGQLIFDMLTGEELPSHKDTISRDGNPYRENPTLRTLSSFAVLGPKSKMSRMQ